MKEQISVIVPVYNVEAYLPHCIDSIIEQTYPNLQIILVDDGSTDNCPAICDEYAAKDSRIQVIHQRNSGLSGARNAGIEAATGSYLSFIDSDDYIHPEFYQRLYEAIVINHADIAVCNYMRVSDWGVNYTGDHLTLVYSDKQTIMGNFYNKKCGISVVAWNKMYRRDLFNHARYPVGRIYEDEALTYKIFYQCKSVVYISDILYYYYIRESSITGKKLSARNLMVFDILKEVIQFYEMNNEVSLKRKAIIRYFKIIQLNIVRIRRECAESKEKLSSNEIYQKLRKIYAEELQNNKLGRYKLFLDAYGLIQMWRGR